MTRPEAEALFPIPAVYLIHGKGESSSGPVKKLQAVVERHWPGLDFIRPDISFNDAKRPTDIALEELSRIPMPEGCLLLGMGLGGLVAARLQELGRQDLQVIAISSPTWSDEVALEGCPARRLAFYSSQDPIIGSKTGSWPRLASFSQDLDWLDQETDRHLTYIARLFDWYLEGTLSRWIHDIRRAAATKQERDESVWKRMARLRKKAEDWDLREWHTGRPRDFAEVGKVVRAGRSWDLAWGDWLHEFVYRKEARCLAVEPPSWFSAERRAMMAGAAEFFANLYDLPKPVWVDKPEYFLAVMEYQAYLASEPGDLHLWRGRPSHVPRFTE